MEPETIEIKVSEYYDQPKYYGDMPEAVFNALEAAFISGAETAIVPKTAFEMMLMSFENNPYRRWRKPPFLPSDRSPCFIGPFVRFGILLQGSRVKCFPLSGNPIYLRSNPKAR